MIKIFESVTEFKLFTGRIIDNELEMRPTTSTPVPGPDDHVHQLPGGHHNLPPSGHHTLPSSGHHALPPSGHHTLPGGVGRSSVRGGQLAISMSDLDDGYSYGVSSLINYIQLYSYFLT